ncbi:MAG TPA: response regulator, partial [Acidobacteriaceae bacterium]|nr:response regulator [Acidobacteriaceae bacterium]
NRGVVALYAELDQHADDLRRVSDLKTSFLSNLSHEFRTPLNSITSLCRMLMNRSDGDLSAEQEKQIGFIQRSAAELTELVNELLDLAKVEAGKVDVKPRHFEIHDLFGAIRGMLKPLLSGNSLELTFDAAPGLPVLYTDEGKVSQILRNLVSNALKFTRRGYVRVTARAESEEWLLFTVEDTGIGVAPENHERIFEEFVQVENELQAQVKGTGLGLPLSKRLAVLLGGSISLESELGKGSIFTVRLPVCYGKPVRSQTVQPVNAGPTDKVVLFIEDNPETSFVHEASLRNSNYRGIFASNIPEARALLRASTPSAVVLDRFIDGQDSLFYIQELKTLGYTGPVIVISIVDDAKSALNAGADAFLAKPITTPAMTSTLGELIQGRNSRSVLLVDDDEVTRYVLGEALARLGYRVLEAHNGREAIRMAKANIPALMILDIVMPDLTGFEVLREIRGSPETKAISVLVHTSKEISTQESQYLIQMNAVFFPKQPIGDQVSSEQLREALASAGMEP